MLSLLQTCMWMFKHSVFASAKNYINSMLTKCNRYISHKTLILWCMSQSKKRVWQADVFMPVPLNFSFNWQTWGIFTNMIITRIHYSRSAEPCAAQHGKNPQPHERSHFPNICENWRGWKVPCCYLISDKRVHERPNFSVLKNCCCWYCCEDNASRPTPVAL